MALVAYDNSDNSDYEDDDQENETVATIITKPEVLHPSTSGPTPKEIEDSSTSDAPTLFNLLPQPTVKKPAVVEEDDEFLHKKEKVDVVKPKAKITVPSLSDFKDVNSPAVVKPKSNNGKKSGLLSMLPQPKHGFVTATARSFIPNVLSQTSSNAKKQALAIPTKVPKTDSKPLINDYSDDSDNDDVQNDFFSIHKPVDIPIADTPADIDQDLSAQAPVSVEPERSKLESYFKKDPVVAPEDIQPEVNSYNSYENSEAGSSSSNGYPEAESTSNNADLVLDEEAILKLCGTRGKRKREEIQIVDVNQQQVLADAKQWYLKGLMEDTSKRTSSSKRKGNEPTSQQKRKHQITYLAHQAKANEAELQNQWANSRMSRRQTQNKYGF